MHMLLRATLTAAAAAPLALPVIGMLSAAGSPYADSRDDQYIAALPAQGIPGAPDQTIAAPGTPPARNYGGPVLVAQMTGLMAQGLSNVQAQDVILDG
jgi:hypothetical protein